MRLRVKLLILVAGACCTWLYVNQGQEKVSICEKERWSCETARCEDVSLAECQGLNGTWLGWRLPSTWRPSGSCFSSPTGLACLPKLLNLAPPKSGSTELFQHLTALPLVVPPQASHFCQKPEFWCAKEPNFWTSPRASIEEYASLYTNLSARIRTGAKSLVSVDWSPLNFEANPWQLLAVFPSAVFVALLRNPVQRAASDYNWAFLVVARSCKLKPKPTPKEMHTQMLSSVERFTSCTKAASDRECWHRLAPQRKLDCSRLRSSDAYVLRGLYSVYLSFFLEVYGLEHFLVRRVEDVDVQNLHTLLAPWLGEQAPQQRQVEKFTGPERRVAMLPETKSSLEGFYKPYVQQLQRIFNDSSLTW